MSGYSLVVYGWAIDSKSMNLLTESGADIEELVDEGIIQVPYSGNGNPASYIGFELASSDCFEEYVKISDVTKQMSDELCDIAIKYNLIKILGKPESLILINCP